MTGPVPNLDEVELKPRPPFLTPPGDAAERYDARMGSIGERLGTRLLGCNITAVPPGKRAFPLHNHHVNEELFLVLQGQGELRMGAERYALRAGDVVACPPGGPEQAHQILNTGADELRYLAVSTRLSPELVEYPDSGKFAVIAEGVKGADGQPRRFRYIGREALGLDYWDGE